MVKLSITPFRGNHQRLWPHSGYLGLTPVVVQGNLRTELEEDNRPLKATHVVVRVRCYEADLTLQHKQKGARRLRVLYELAETVWSKPAGEEYGTLGNYAVPFRITIPQECDAVSTLSFRDFRTFWQVEAVVFHKPAPIIGSRKRVAKQIALVRYSPSPLAYTLPAPSWQGVSRHSRVRYSIATPKCIYGPDDPLELDFFLERDEASTTIKKVQVSLDRHLVLDHTGSRPTSGSDDDDDVRVPDSEDLASPGIVEGSVRSSRSSSTDPSVARSLSRGWTPTASPSASALDSESYFAPRRSLVTPLVPSGSSVPASPGRLTIDSNVVSFDRDDPPVGEAFKLAAAVPRSRSLYRYSVGETLRTSLAYLHFTLAVKVVIRTPLGLEVIELEPRAIAVTTSSSSDRTEALSKASKQLLVSDAEQRLFDKSATNVAPVRQPRKKSTLGVRRSSHFTLTISTETLDADVTAAPSPTRSVGSPTRPDEADDWPLQQSSRHEKSTRKRSEQLEALELPVRSKARVTERSSRSPSPSPQTSCPPSELFPGFQQPPLVRMTPSSSAPMGSKNAPHGYVASALGRYSPIVQQHESPGIEQHGTLSSIPLHSPASLPGAGVHSPASLHSAVHSPASLHSGGVHSPASLHSGGEQHDLARRTSRQRLARSNAPYSTANRPRSSGGHSLSSQRSRDESSCSGSVSGLSVTASSSSLSLSNARFSREKPTTTSTPLDLSQEVLLLPLSIHSRPRGSTLIPLADHGSTLPVPSSPSMSDCSDSSDGSDLPSPPIQCPIAFHSFSLATPGVPSAASRVEIAPWLLEDVGPLDKSGRPYAPQMGASQMGDGKGSAGPRRASLTVLAQSPGRRHSPSPHSGSGPRLSPTGVEDSSRAAASPGRRKSSVGFGLFSKGSPVGEDDEGGGSPKDLGRWAFLRRGSKA